MGLGLLLFDQNKLGYKRRHLGEGQLADLDKLDLISPQGPQRG
jgi:hypothetical protein